MFYSIVDLVEQASTQYQGNVAELMIATEFELTGREREEVLRLMTRNLEVMIDSVKLGLNENHSRSGLTGGDAAKLDRYIKSGKTLSDGSSGMGNRLYRMREGCQISQTST